MTPSAVTQQLKILGREAGVSLLEPDGRTLRLTDAGRALVLRADDMVAALDRAADEMASYRGSPRGKVRVAFFPSGAALLLPGRSEEHPSELQSLMRISYAVFCLNTKTHN